MAILNYALVALISSLGVIFGYSLGKIAKEELKKGEKYLNLLKQFILSTILFFLLLGFNINLYTSLLISTLFLLLLHLILKKFVNKDTLIYFLLSVVFFAGNKTNYFLINSSLIFIYGLPAGSIMFYKKRKFGYPIKLVLFFLIVSLLPFFFF